MVKDYSKGKIYRIVSDQTNEVYIGSTIQTLEARFRVHKYDFKRGVYCSSSELLKHGDARIELIRDFPCNSERELAKEETNHMLACPNPVVNHNRASRTKAEYYQDNRVEIAEKAKHYYEANREELLDKVKQYQDAHREQITEYQKQYREAHRERISEYNTQYREENREQISEYQNQYREDNRAKINEKSKQKYDCPCGSTISKSNKSGHEKSKHHQDYINRQNSEEE